MAKKNPNPNQSADDAAAAESVANAGAKAAAAQPSTRGQQEESYKETFESVVIAFILAFVFRAYVVEAFVIPTGSMAPTLLGEHYDLDCAKCGYNYKVDAKSQSASPRTGGPPHNDTVIPCPMCHFPNRLFQPATDENGYFVLDGNGYPSDYKARVRPKSGDRILVQKYVNSMMRRFDVVVFKAPHQPFTNYIKRLIGLEGEALMVVEGNIFVNTTPDDETGWRIARKTDPNENPHAFAIQKTVWQPIYHSQYVPLDWNEPDVREVDRSRRRLTKHGREDSQIFRVPWVPDNDGVENAWKTAQSPSDLDPSAGYRHDSNSAGRIRFDFDRFWEGGPGFFPYQLAYGTDQSRLSGLNGSVKNIPVEDIRLAAAFQPDSDGLNVTLRTTCRMDDQEGVMRTLLVTVDHEGNVTLGRKQAIEVKETTVLASAKVKPFAANETRHVELWYVDQEASVWIDGERVITQTFDLPMEFVRSRAMPCELLPSGFLATRGRGLNNLRTPDVAIEVSGSPVSIHRVELDRDLFYLSSNAVDPLPGSVLRAALVKFRDDAGNIQTYGEPKVLRKDEFFCMGDNSPDSHDSRGWDDVDYWVKKRTIAEGSPDYESHGVVPARLMMGRAFFVYFPAPHGLNGRTISIIPNFGDMRFIH